MLQQEGTKPSNIIWISVTLQFDKFVITSDCSYTRNTFSCRSTTKYSRRVNNLPTAFPRIELLIGPTYFHETVRPPQKNLNKDTITTLYHFGIQNRYH